MADRVLQQGVRAIVVPGSSGAETEDDRITSVRGHEPKIDAELFEPLTVAIGKLDLEPGDILVVTIPERDCTGQLASEVKCHIEGVLGQGIRVLPIPDTWALGRLAARQ